MKRKGILYFKIYMATKRQNNGKTMVKHCHDTSIEPLSLSLKSFSVELIYCFAKTLFWFLFYHPHIFGIPERLSDLWPLSDSCIPIYQYFSWHPYYAFQFRKLIPLPPYNKYGRRDLLSDLVFNKFRFHSCSAALKKIQRWGSINERIEIGILWLFERRKQDKKTWVVVVVVLLSTAHPTLQ